MRRLHDNPGLRKTLGSMGRMQAVLDFDVNVMPARQRDVYQRLSPGLRLSGSGGAATAPGQGTQPAPGQFGPAVVNDQTSPPQP